MNIGDIRSPAQFWRLVEYRILRPRIWEYRLARQSRGLSDENFLALWPTRPASSEFLPWFQNQSRFRFFFHPRNQKDFFLSLLSASQPQDEILQEAQDVLENRFQTLGSEKVTLGENIDWHRDFKSGKAWPVEPKSRLDLMDLGNPSDVKVPWELSRFHQIWWLGKAYWLTHREIYAEKFRDLVEHWIENNPPGRGVNWSVAMEVAIRASNWIAGYYFFCESQTLTRDFWMKFLKSLHAHGTYIENNLEYHWRNGNHFLSDVVGLIFLGIFFQDADFGKRWLQLGIAALPEEMERQVYPDGVDYEKSTSYQRLVLELFYTPAILCQKNNIRLPEHFFQRLEKMFEYVQHYSRPDGSLPLFGDADDGRLFRFAMGETINDHRHTLSVGSILFERSDLAISAGKFHQDSLWLFGGEGFEKHQRLARGPSEERISSRAFPDGGFFIMRNNRIHLMIDAGDIGMKGWGGHGHNDTLSFELWADGEPLIVDSGTYAYTFDVPARQEFRGVRSHNTVMIDGKEPATFVGLWMILRDQTRPEVYEWITSERSDVLEAAHHAYRSLALPVIHRRRFELDKQRTVLTITDMIQGTGHHRIESFLHFAPHIRLEKQSTRVVKVVGRSIYTVETDSGELSILNSRFSRSYGVVEPNRMVVLTYDATVPVDIRLKIYKNELPPE